MNLQDELEKQHLKKLWEIQRTNIKALDMAIQSLPQPWDGFMKTKITNEGLVMEIELDLLKTRLKYIGSPIPYEVMALNGDGKNSYNIGYTKDYVAMYCDMAAENNEHKLKKAWKKISDF